MDGTLHNYVKLWIYSKKKFLFSFKKIQEVQKCIVLQYQRLDEYMYTDEFLLQNRGNFFPFHSLRKHVHVINRKFFGFKNEKFHRKKMIFFLFLLKT